MPAPHQVVIGPLTLYLAPVGTAFPKVHLAPAVDWIMVGTEGNRDYDDDGVTVTHSQTLEEFRGAGSTAPRKVYRTEEGLMMGFTLVDTSPLQYAQALNNATVVTTAAGAAQAGEKAIDLHQGLNVAQFALLGRGPSSVDNSLNAQHEWPTVYQSAEPAVVHSKNGPDALELEFTALEVTAGNFGKLRIQTAVPTS